MLADEQVYVEMPDRANSLPGAAAALATANPYLDAMTDVPGTSKLLAIDRLQNEIARALLTMCRNLGIAEVELSAISLVGSTSLKAWNTGVPGVAGSLRPPMDAAGPIVALREACYVPGEGTWLSVRVLVQDSGTFQFHFNYRQRPFTNSEERDRLTPRPGDREPAPNDYALLADLAKFPRNPDAVPDWYPRPTDAVGKLVSGQTPPADGRQSAPVVPEEPMVSEAPMVREAPTVPEAPSSQENSSVRRARIEQLEADIVGVLQRMVRTMDLVRLVFTFAGLNGTGTATLYDPTSVAGGMQINVADRSYQRLDADQLPMASLLELRELKSEPGTGAWFSVVVRVGGVGGGDAAGDGDGPSGEVGGTAGAAGDHSFTYNYDRRIYYNSPSPEMDVAPDHSSPDPTSQEYLDDLRRYPRNAVALPAWYPRMPTTAEMQVPVLDVTTTMTSPAERAALGSEASLFPVELSVLHGSRDWGLIARAVKVHAVAVLTSHSPSWEHDGDNEWVSSTIFNLVYEEKIADATAAGVKALWRAGAQLFSGRAVEHIPDAELVSAPSEDLEELLEDVCDVIGDLVNHRLAAAAGLPD